MADMASKRLKWISWTSWPGASWAAAAVNSLVMSIHSVLVTSISLVSGTRFGFPAVFDTASAGRFSESEVGPVVASQSLTVSSPSPAFVRAISRICWTFSFSSSNDLHLSRVSHVPSVTTAFS